MNLKEIAAKLLCFLALLGCFATGAYADWYDDVKPGSTWVEIEGDNFVADTFLGVPALYNEGNRNYQCNEIVMRFYREAYGLEIRAYNESDPKSLTEGYEFVKTKSPKKGDIIFVSAEMRGSDMDHWAIVKDYSDGYITMFEQNAIWNGKAAVERKIKFPSDSYYIYTPVSTGDAPAPVLKGASTETTDKVPEPSSKPAEATTSAPSTTKAPATSVPTTKAPETTKAATTKAATTKQPATVAKTTVPQTTRAETTASVTETTSAVTTQTVTEEHTTEALRGVAAIQGELNTTAPATEHTEAAMKAPEENNSTMKTVLLALGVGVAAIGVAALSIVIFKNKKHN